MTDRSGGRDILAAGLCLWGLGLGLVIWSIRPYHERSILITGLVLAGLGLGMTFAPLQTIAMRNIQPRMAGAAAGVINAARQFGAVIGGAAIGALLQIQLAARLDESARINADALPMSVRTRFVEGFSHAGTSKGLQVGTGQTGGHLPDVIPESVRPGVLQVATKTFYEAYLPAMRITLLLPLAVLALAAVAVLLVRPGSRADER
jgi:hypothetical protein